MKKLLGIVVLGMLWSYPVFSKILNFEKCYSQSEYSSYKKSLKDKDRWYDFEWQIDTSQRSATRTIIATESLKAHSKKYNTSFQKYEQEHWKIEHVTNNYISTAFQTVDLGLIIQHTFDLKKGIIETKRNHGGKIKTVMILKCKVK